MKRWFGLFIAIGLMFLGSTPALAQGPSAGDQVCFGGYQTVAANATPESVVLFGCGGRISSGARVRRDIISFGGNVVLEEGAQVGNDVVVFGGNVDVGGQVGHQVVSLGGNVTLEPGSVVQNNVQSFGGFVDRKEGAIVRGRVTNGAPGTRFGPTTPFMYNYANNGFGMVGGLVTGLIRSFVTALALAALGALVLVFLPDQVRLVSQTAARSALPSIGVGCLTWLVAPPLMILFVITCLGIPLAAVLGVLLAAAAVFGWVAVSMYLGERLLGSLKTVTVVPLAAMIVGLFVLWLLTELPILGGLILILVGSLALGAVVLSRFGTRPYPPAAPAISALIPVAPTAPTAPTMPTPPDAPPAPTAPTGPTAPTVPTPPAPPVPPVAPAAPSEGNP